MHTNWYEFFRQDDKIFSGHKKHEEKLATDEPAHRRGLAKGEHRFTQIFYPRREQESDYESGTDF